MKLHLKTTIVPTLVLFAALLHPTSLQAQWTSAGFNGEMRIMSIIVSDDTLFIGPYNMGIYLSGDNGAGWVKSDSGFAPNTTVMCYAQKKGHLFAGTSGYGVYLSADNGKKWKPVNAGISNALVNALCLIGDELFAGTSNGGGFPSNYKGLFRSTDDGTTWTPAGAVAGLDGKNIFSLLARSDTLFAGTDSGVFISSDKGTTWHVSTTGMVNLSVNALALTAGKIYAGTKYYGIYVSTDGGANWISANTGIGEPTNCFITSFFEDSGKLFAATPDKLFRFADSGNGWTQITAGVPAGLGITSLAKNSAGLFAASYQGLFRSSDNGESWSPVRTGIANGEILSLFHSNGTLFAGVRSRGIFSSADNGETWVSANAGFDVSRGAFCFAQHESTLIAGTGSGIVLSRNNGKNWTIPANTGANLVLMRFLAGKDGYLFAGTTSGMMRSADWGENWTPINNGFRTGMLSREIYSFATGNGKLFVGPYGGGIYVSADNGENWAAPQPGLGIDNVLAILIKDNLIIAGNRGMGVYRSLDGGANWKCPNDGVSHFWSAEVASLVDYNNCIFAGTDAYGVWLSKDDGVTWKAVNEGLAARTKITALTVSGNYLVAGTATNGALRRPLSEMVEVVETRAPQELSPHTCFNSFHCTSSGSTTTISFSLLQQGSVSVKVFTTSGRAMTSPAEGRFKPGTYNLKWHTGNVAPGYYLVSLENGSERYAEGVYVCR